MKISGEILTDEDSLKRYSSDMSHYTVKPQVVVAPRNEEDIASILSYSKETSIPLTPRGSGSNLSGSAVGGGIVVSFSHLKAIGRRGSRSARTQPGIVYDTLDKIWRKDGMRLPYDPSSRSFCTIGGNVATRASGIRSIKYGTVDSALRSIRFLDMAHGLVDTDETLPTELEYEIVSLRNKLQNDESVKRILDKRSWLKSSSGYNIGAFYKHSDPRDIVAHLLTGSVGTLGVFIEIELEAVTVPKRKILLMLFYRSLAEAAAEVEGIRNLGPSSLEIMDEHGLRIFREEHELNFPRESKAVLMVEFDSDLDRAEMLITHRMQESRSIEYLIEDDPERQTSLWSVRESMLLRIIHEMQTTSEKFPSFADDIGVPVANLAPFLVTLEEIIKNAGTVAVIFGHAGEGNLHVRPMVKTENWENSIRTLSDLIFKATLRFGGTISAEHGLGRNRSKYLKDEWGEAVYGYFQEIKRIFDPRDLLNPGIVFTSQDLATNLKL